MAEVAIQPTNIPEAISNLETQIASIRVKNTTMIGWYIHPDPTPSAIAAYEPRINILAKRLTAIDTIHVPNLGLLLNDASSCVAHDLLEITSQLSVAVYGFQTLFIEHYDPTLREALPYLPIFQTLKYLEQQLIHFMRYHREENPYRRPADALLPAPSTLLPTFCKTAVAFVNQEDRGRITTCPPNELDNSSRARLRSHGGVCVWWECQHCAFRLRVHVSNSATMNINETDETRTHTALPDLEYRSSWLAKSHLYHFGREEQSIERERRRLSGLLSTSRYPISTNIPLNTYGVGGVKYGCILCVAAGKNLILPSLDKALKGKETCFPHAKDYAVHLAEKHGLADLPPSLILEKFKVGVKGEMARNVKRWDINVL